ncbi:MAG: holin family protein [Alphaproteobacteria bacterium]|nr:holin family protein [Alphaproteobacteria bacterium]
MPAWIALIDPISRLLDKLIPDPDARARAQEELRKAEREEDLEALKLAITSDQAQAASDQQEAGNASLFVCGWRPFIGWVCGVAFAYHFILQPLLAFTLMSAHRPVSLPAFDMQTLTTVLMGMLGLGSLRTLEKLRGVQ